MGTTAQTAPVPGSPFSEGVRFFTDDDFNGAARFAMSKATQGVMDFGMVLATLGRITDASPQSWLQEWVHTGQQLERQATTSSAAGHALSAGWFLLGAAECYSRALAFIAGMDDDSALLPTFQAHRRCWDAFLHHTRGQHLAVRVPYEDATLPGYLFRPDATGTARTTLVITNGSDGSLSGLWAEGIATGLARGWNVFVYDGPGQQSMLFEHGVPFRHDWEHVLTPVVDTLLEREDVDERRLVASGISQGGYWLPRALAFEHRFVAAAVDGGVWDVSRTWNANLPEPMLQLLAVGDRDTFDQYMASGPADPVQERTFRFRARPYGPFTSAFDLFTAVSRYRLDEVATSITTPMLVCDPDDEEFFPGQPQQLYDALTCEKELARFRREDGANHHCEPWARTLVGARMCDFFDRHLEQAPQRTVLQPAPGS
ncbi:alpha/beta fold hydrolase [Kocuria sp. CPCC 205236]